MDEATAVPAPIPRFPPMKKPGREETPNGEGDADDGPKKKKKKPGPKKEEIKVEK